MKILAPHESPQRQTESDAPAESDASPPTAEFAPPASTIGIQSVPPLPKPERPPNTAPIPVPTTPAQTPKAGELQPPSGRRDFPSRRIVIAAALIAGTLAAYSYIRQNNLPTNPTPREPPLLVSSLTANGALAPTPFQSPPVDDSRLNSAPTAGLPMISSRPAANFGSPPHVIVGSERASTPPTAAPKSSANVDVPLKRWTFAGLLFDLRTSRGVYGARLEFIDATGATVGMSESDNDGRYRISLPESRHGSGYQVRVIHPDYQQRFIDQGDEAGALRQASPSERALLMKAAPRMPPWVGDSAHTVKRDLALIPNSADAR